MSNLTRLVRMAARQGAKIVVTPECSVQGYMDPTIWACWLSEEGGSLSVRSIAEPVPGPITRVFAQLADELNIYLCVGLIEAASNRFFNSQILFAPEGAMIAHHRKRALWTPGDSTWCTKGDRPVQVVPTEYGNLGLMICYDFHSLPPLLAKQEADIVLYSVGWYGPNEAEWFGRSFPSRAVIPYGFDVVVANWASPSPEKSWPGRGHSCILTRDGKVLAMSRAVFGNDIVLADLEIKKRRKAP